MPGAMDSSPAASMGLATFTSGWAFASPGVCLVKSPLALACSPLSPATPLVCRPFACSLWRLLFSVPQIFFQAAFRMPTLTMGTMLRPTTQYQPSPSSFSASVSWFSASWGSRDVWRQFTPDNMSATCTTSLPLCQRRMSFAHAAAQVVRFVKWLVIRLITIRRMRKCVQKRGWEQIQ